MSATGLTKQKPRRLDNIELKSLVEVQAGYQFRDRVESIPEADGFLVQLKDYLDSGELHPSGNLTAIRTAGIGEQYYLSDGDVLVPSRGRYSLAAVVRNPARNTVASGHFYILRAKSGELDPGYLTWFLNSRAGQVHLEKYKRGTSIPVLSKTGIEGLPIPLPPLKTQQAISELSLLSRKEKKLQTRLLALRAVRLEAEIFHTMDISNSGALR